MLIRANHRVLFTVVKIVVLLHNSVISRRLLLLLNHTRSPLILKSRTSPPAVHTGMSLLSVQLRRYFYAPRRLVEGTGKSLIIKLGF